MITSISSIKSDMEFLAPDGQHKIMYHPDLGWCFYIRYAGDWELEIPNMSRPEILEYILEDGYRKVSG